MTTKKEFGKLRIVRLESENVKRLRAVHISPKGDVVQITGANDNGKTSVLDSIWLALDQVRVDAPMPLRKGEKKARVRLDLGSADGVVELVVERKFSEKGGGLEICTAEGAKLPSPQKLLDSLIGSLSFDPLAFTRMKAREQYDELRATVKVEVDIDQLDALNAGDFSKRTEITRQAKERRAEAEGITIPEAKGGVVDTREILDQIESAAQHNANIEATMSRRRSILEKATRLESSAADDKAVAAKLRAQAADLDESALKQEDEARAMRKAVTEGAGVPEPLDVGNLRLELERAQTENKVHEARAAGIERHRLVVAQAEEMEAKAREITDRMAAREQAKALAIQAAQMPVEGLGFGDGIVTYKGVPFQQASSAVQLRVSLGIAMAANPKLRVIRIQDGSLLDDTSMAAVAEMAKDRDFQIWVERVDTSGKVGIFIEDGAVKAVDGVVAQ